MIYTAALTPEASLADMQPVMRVQPCGEAGVYHLCVQLTHHIQERDAPVVTRVLLITLLEDVHNVSRAPRHRHQLRGPQGLHEPSKHVQEGWAPVLEHLVDNPFLRASLMVAQPLHASNFSLFFPFFFLWRKKPYMSANLANDSSTQQTDKGNL